MPERNDSQKQAFAVATDMLLNVAMAIANMHGVCPVCLVEQAFDTMMDAVDDGAIQHDSAPDRPPQPTHSPPGKVQ
jgi:hypothetical protein